MENLGIDFKLLLAQTINFILFFVIFKKFIAIPFMKFFNSEKKKDLEREVLNMKMKKFEEEMIVKEAKFEASMKEKVAKILEDAKKTGAQIKAEMMTEAEYAASEIKVKASKDLMDEREKLFKEAKEKVFDLSIVMIREALKDVLDETTKKRITANILKNSASSLKFNEN